MLGSRDFYGRAYHGWLPAPCSGYAIHPNRAIGGERTRTPQIRQTCWLLRSLHLHRGGLAPPTSCRYPGARSYWHDSDSLAGAANCGRKSFCTNHRAIRVGQRHDVSSREAGVAHLSPMRRSRWSQGRGPRGTWASKARNGHRADITFGPVKVELEFTGATNFFPPELQGQAALNRCALPQMSRRQ